MSHTIICPECGSYFSKIDINFDLTEIIAPMIFQNEEPENIDKQEKELLESGFKFIIDTQFIIDNIIDKNINRLEIINNNINVDKKDTVKVSITKETIIIYLCRFLNMISHDLKENLMLYFENKLQENEKLQFFSDISRVFFKNITTNPQQYAESIFNNITNFKEKKIRVKLHKMNNKNDFLEVFTEDKSFQIFGCCLKCGLVLPDAFCNNKIMPVLLFGGQQTGKTSLITAMCWHIGRAQDSLRSMLNTSISIITPKKREENKTYCDNMEYYNLGIDVKKTDVSKNAKAPLCSFEINFIDKSKRIILPFVDIPGESILAKNDVGEWTSLDRNRLDDSGIRKLALRAKSVIFCISPEMMYKNDRTPLVVTSNDNNSTQKSKKVEQSIPIDLLVSVFEYIRNNYLKTIYVVITKFDLLYSDNDVSNVDSLIKKINKYENSRHTDDFGKTYDVVCNDIKDVSDSTKKVLRKFNDCKGLNIVSVFEQFNNDNINVYYLPVSPYGIKPNSIISKLPDETSFENNENRNKPLFVSLPLIAIINDLNKEKND